MGNEIIFCNTDETISEKPVFLIVYFGLGNKLIAKFKQREYAENYVDIILRGYIQFVYKD